jgi:hypothetical protein
MTRTGTLTLSAMATLATLATTVTSFWEVYGEEHPENRRQVLAITQSEDGTLRYRDLAAA